MFAAHSVAATSAAERKQPLGDTNDGDPVLFYAQIFLLTSNAGDGGQWVPQVMIVTKRALRISNTIDGCLGLPRYEVPLRHLRFAGTDFSAMKDRFSHEEFFKSFAAYMRTWRETVADSPSNMSEAPTMDRTMSTESKSGDESLDDTLVNPDSAGTTQATEEISGRAASTSSVDTDPALDSEGIVGVTLDTSENETLAAALQTDNDSANASVDEVSSLLLETELAALQNVRGLYFVDQHGMCLCCAFSDDEAKEACHAVVWEQLQKTLKQGLDVQETYIVSAHSRGCKYTPSCMFTPVTTSGFCNAHRALVANSATNEQTNWVIDDVFSRCQYCQKSFDMLLRRHHCRSVLSLTLVYMALDDPARCCFVCRLCGSLVCSDCSPYRAFISFKKKKGPYRLCTNCHLKSRPAGSPDALRVQSGLWLSSTVSRSPRPSFNTLSPSVSRSSSTRSVSRPPRGSSAGSAAAADVGSEAFSDPGARAATPIVSNGGTEGNSGPDRGDEPEGGAPTEGVNDDGDHDGSEDADIDECDKASDDGAGDENASDDHEEEGESENEDGDDDSPVDGDEVAAEDVEESGSGRVAVSGPVRKRLGSEFMVVEQPLEPFRDLPAPLENLIASVRGQQELFGWLCASVVEQSCALCCGCAGHGENARHGVEKTLLFKRIKVPSKILMILCTCRILVIICHVTPLLAAETVQRA